MIDRHPHRDYNFIYKDYLMRWQSIIYQNFYPISKVPKSKPEIKVNYIRSKEFIQVLCSLYRFYGVYYVLWNLNRFYGIYSQVLWKLYRFYGVYIGNMEFILVLWNLYLGSKEFVQILWSLYRLYGVYIGSMEFNYVL